jgi:hypothetical protein
MFNGALTINAQGSQESEPTAMIQEVQKLFVVTAAFVLFLCAAQVAAGLTWRGLPAITAASR